MTAAAIILAAGKGTRMKSDLPKVLHPVCGQPMLTYVINACRGAGCDRLILVVGHRHEWVRETYASLDGNVAYVMQEPQQGTGHAVMVCQDELAWLEGPVLVVAGDGPLIQSHTLRELLAVHTQTNAACTLATSILPDPAKYGRILRDERGELASIVEFVDATPEQLAVKEVNVSVYCFDAAALRSVLPRLTNNNNKNEYYLTDALGLLRADGQKLAAVAAVPPEDVMSINTIDELDLVSRMMISRTGADRDARSRS
ncbi:MAG: NTP transferase domain-containing protein [Phycisphaerae bacterium]|nr:NTP transferase domain-containing protein [Phycisphaerae bacterium]